MSKTEELELLVHAVQTAKNYLAEFLRNNYKKGDEIRYKSKFGSSTKKGKIIGWHETGFIVSVSKNVTETVPYQSVEN